MILLQNQINAVIQSIADPELCSISETILGEMLRFFDWLARIENNLKKRTRRYFTGSCVIWKFYMAT